MKEKHTELSLLVEQVILGESVEQIDELKKETLGSYIGKASKDLEKGTIIGTKIHALTTGMHRNSHQWMRDDANHYKRSGKRVAGIKAATDKLVKGQYQESFDFLDAIEYLDEDQLQLVAGIVIELLEASYDREIDPKKPIIVHGVKGMKSTPFKKKFKNMDAYDKWSDSDEYGNHEVHTVQNQDQYNEEIEELDELKASTLGSYVKKASRDAIDKSDKANYAFANRNHKAAFAMGDKVDKRLAGIEKATDKLVKGQVTKEDVDTIINSFNYLSEDQLRVVAHVIDHLLED